MSTTTSKSIWNFDPRSVPGCVLWLDAEDKSTLTGTSPVTAWRDKSVLSNNTTSYGGSPSVTSSIYGRKAMYFNGSTYLTGSISAASSTTITVFLVGSLISPFGGFSGLLCFGNPSQYDYDNVGSLPITMYNDQYKIYGARNSSSQPTPVTSNVPFIYVLQYDGSYINSWKNGTIQTDPSSNISNSGTFTYTHYAVGSRAGAILGQYTWSGYIGEVIVYQSPVTATNRQEIEGYLAWKWGFIENANFLYTHPFISIKPYLRTFQPRDILGCVLWLDGSDTSTITLNGSNVSSWSDKSGNGYSVNQSTSANQPVYATKLLNGLPGIQLSSTRYLYQIGSNMPNFTSSSSTTVFIVAKNGSSYTSFGWNLISSIWFNGVATSRYHFSFGLGTTNNVTLYPNSGSSVSLNSNAIIGFTISESGNSINVNGVLTNYSGTAAASADNSTWFQIGDYRGASCNEFYVTNENIYEFIGFDTALTTAQRQQVEGYLAWKWGLVTSIPSTHPFKKFRPSTALPFLPKQITGLSLWLDANDPAGTGTQPSAGALGTWIDKSGLNNHMTGVGTTPSFLNAPPGIVFFDGSGYYSNSNPVLSNVYTLFITYVSFDPSAGPLYTTGASSGYSGLFPNESGTLYLTRGDCNWYTNSTMLPNNQINLVAITYSANEVGSNISLYYNGSNAISTTQIDTVTYSNFLLGTRQSGGTNYFNGVMLEVIAYNGTLTTREQQSVEGYLAQKWKL
jgi:hypothetical protein